MWLERKFYAAPKLIVFIDAVWIIVEDPQVSTSDDLPHDYPHALDPIGTIIFIDMNLEDELHQVTRPQALPSH